MEPTMNAVQRRWIKAATARERDGCAALADAPSRFALGRGFSPRAFAFIGAWVLSCALAAPAVAQWGDSQIPREFEGVGTVQKLGEQVPLDLAFVDENGREVALSEYFRPGRPVILTLNYYECPMLCILTLNGVVAALRDIDWTPGNQFALVTVSINPNERPGLAKRKRENYLESYNRVVGEGGWPFLTGKQENIEKLAEAVGFGYRYDPRSGEYAHSSTIIFVTPDGRISKYMNDVMFEPRDVRFALVEASQGGIGTPMDRMLLFTCFQWDPDSGSYVPAAWKIMRSGAALTIVLLGGGLFVLWWRGGKYERAEAPGGRSMAGDVAAPPDAPASPVH
jgi:protein SCO1